MVSQLGTPRPDVIVRGQLETQELVQALFAQLHDVQARLLTCAIRGEINGNMASELQRKLCYMADQITPS